MGAAGQLGRRVRVAGMRQTWRRTRTVKGDYLYFMSLEDLEGMLDVVISGDVYQRHRTALASHGPYVLEGRVEWNEGRASRSFAPSGSGGWMTAGPEGGGLRI